MILDTMTYSVMTVVAVMSFIVILLEGVFKNQSTGNEK